MVLSTFAATYLFFLFVTTNLSKPRDKGGLGGGVCEVWGSSAGSFFSPSSLPLPTVSPWQLTDERGIPGDTGGLGARRPIPSPFSTTCAPSSKSPFLCGLPFLPLKGKGGSSGPLQGPFQLRSSPPSQRVYVITKPPDFTLEERDQWHLA